MEKIPFFNIKIKQLKPSKPLCLKGFQPVLELQIGLVTA
jgi:hypothetical protein